MNCVRFVIALAFVSLAFSTAVPHKKLEVADLEKELDDPQISDLFKSTASKVSHLNENTHLAEIRSTFRSLVVAIRLRVAASFRKIRSGLFLEPPVKNVTAVNNTNVTEDGNSTAKQERGPGVIVDHIGTFDGLFRTWIPTMKKDLELTSLLLGKLASDLGAKTRELSHEVQEELRRIPIKYGRLRRKLLHAFSREKHDDHAELHRARMIQSECGKQYTLEQFVEMFDHDHNLALTEEANWSHEFKDEWYSGWPVFATQMKLHDPACGSTKWSLPPTEKKEL